jgi:hypothetical protein
MSILVPMDVLKKNLGRGSTTEDVYGFGCVCVAKRYSATFQKPVPGVLSTG